MSKVFLEKPFYIEPPDLASTATEPEIKKAWANWLIANAKERANHKRAWTKSQKPGDLPNFDRAGTMAKINGVWKQQPGMVGLIGDIGSGTLEAVLIEPAKQDRHYQPRGKRAGRLGNKHKNKRSKTRESKRQLILNKKAQLSS